MKKPQVGLLIEGNSTSSTLLRLPGFAAELGPIKSSSLQVARRVSNFLKGGHAVNNYTDLAAAQIILIRVPDASVDRIVAELCDCGLNLADHSFMLCETWLPTEKLEPLRFGGARIASLVVLPSNLEKTFLVEGDLGLVRQVRRMIERARVHTVELRPGSKHLLFAATAMCTAIPVPLLLMAQQALRDAGVSGNQLSTVMQQMTDEMLAGFLKGARTTWGGPLADLLVTGDGEYWDRLMVTHPELGQTLREWLDWSRLQMSPKTGRGQSA